MKQFLRLSGFLLGLTFLAWLALAGQEDRTRSLSELPQAVLSILKSTFPDAEVKRIEKTGDADDDDDDRRFELELAARPDRRRIDLEITRSGELLEIDERVPASELPEGVRRALRKAFPGGEIVQAEKESEIEITYRVQVTARDRKREVKLTRRGRIVEIENSR
jgi:hypothetical protein